MRKLFLGKTSGDLSWPFVNFLNHVNLSYSISHYLTSLENYAQSYKHYPKSKNIDSRKLFQDSPPVTFGDLWWLNVNIQISLMHHIQFLNITKVWKIMHRAIKYIYDMIRKKIFKNMHICHISVIYYGILDFNSQRFYFTVICKNYQ